MSQGQSNDRQVRRVVLIEGAANLLVLLSKLGVGLPTGVMAIIADTIHSLADFTNNVIAWTVIHFASKPAEHKHPYGHRKLETLRYLYGHLKSLSMQSGQISRRSFPAALNYRFC